MYDRVTNQSERNWGNCDTCFLGSLTVERNITTWVRISHSKLEWSFAYCPHRNFYKYQLASIKLHLPHSCGLQSNLSFWVMVSNWFIGFNSSSCIAAFLSHGAASDSALPKPISKELFLKLSFLRNLFVCFPDEAFDSSFSSSFAPLIWGGSTEYEVMNSSLWQSSMTSSRPFLHSFRRYMWVRVDQRRGGLRSLSMAGHRLRRGRLQDDGWRQTREGMAAFRPALLYFVPIKVKRTKILGVWFQHTFCDQLDPLLQLIDAWLL